MHPVNVILMSGDLYQLKHPPRKNQEPVARCNAFGPDTPIYDLGRVALIRKTTYPLWVVCTKSAPDPHDARWVKQVGWTSIFFAPSKDIIEDYGLEFDYQAQELYAWQRLFMTVLGINLPVGMFDGGQVRQHLRNKRQFLGIEWVEDQERQPKKP